MEKQYFFWHVIYSEQGCSKIQSFSYLLLLLLGYFSLWNVAYVYECLEQCMLVNVEQCYMLNHKFGCMLEILNVEQCFFVLYCMIGFGLVHDLIFYAIS